MKKIKMITAIVNIKSTIVYDDNSIGEVETNNLLATQEGKRHEIVQMTWDTTNHAVDQKFTFEASLPRVLVNDEQL